MSIAARARRPAMAIPPRAARFIAAREISFVDRWLTFACLVLLLTLNIALPALMIAGVPVRSVVACGLLIALSLFYPEVAATAVRKCRPLLWIAAVLAAIGIFVSLVNGTAPDQIARAVLEMNIQPAVVIMVAFILAQMCGARACVIAIVGIVAIGGAIAILQALGLDSAWEVRRLLASIQTQELDEPNPFDIGRRPLGLSYSTIQLATQLCLAFVVYTAVRDKERSSRLQAATADPAVIPALLALVVGSVASGNRSPILGALIFFGIYTARRRGSWMPFLLLSASLVLLLAWPIIASAMELGQLRVLRTGDQSAVGRLPMLTFGVQLFLDNPLGYGFGFRPFEHWTAYWDQLYTFPGALVIQTRDLHNYGLNMLNTYGVGLLLIVPAVSALFRRGGASLIFFVPYAVHIMFHNSGPFWNDMIIWFVIAAISVAGAGGPPKKVASAMAQATSLGVHRCVSQGRRWREVNSAEW